MTPTENLQALIEHFHDCVIGHYAGRLPREAKDASLAALRSALEALIRDAERYRYLRDCTNQSWEDWHDDRPANAKDAEVDEWINAIAAGLRYPGDTDAARSAEPQAGETKV